MGRVGWTPSDIATCRSRGNSVKLLVWRAPAGERPVNTLATWDRVFQAVLPMAAATGHTDLAIKGCWSSNAATNAQFVKRVTGMRAAIEAFAMSPGDMDRSVGVEQFMSEPSPLNARRVLSNLLYLDPLFAGDGMLRDGYNSNNKSGEADADDGPLLREYLVATPQVPIAQLPDLEVVEYQWEHKPKPKPHQGTA